MIKEALIVWIAVVSAFYISSATFLYAGPAISEQEREFRDNNFTLSYGISEGGIFPSSYSANYNSGNNTVFSVTCEVLKGHCLAHTHNLTEAGKNKLVDILVQGNLLYTKFNDECSREMCGPSHLTVSIPSLNKSNSLSWSDEAWRTIDHLNSVSKILSGGTIISNSSNSD